MWIDDMMYPGRPIPAELIERYGPREYIPMPVTRAAEMDTHLARERYPHDLPRSPYYRSSIDRASRSCRGSAGHEGKRLFATRMFTPPTCALARSRVYTTHSAIKNILKGCHGLREGVFAADDDEVRRDV